MRVTQTLVLISAVVGCAEGGFDTQSNPRIVLNTIAFDDIVANQSAMTTLASAKFSLNNPAAASMLTSDSSRQVLDYLVGCALPSNQHFSVNANGTTYTFHGDAGLAKSWTSVKLTDKQKRWVSACMLARVNNQHQILKISLRGPHHALHVTNAEVGRFTLEEGVYYGDIFTGTNPLIGWSCQGQAQAAGEPDGGDTALALRDCAEPSGTSSGGDVFGTPGENQCGWGYAGNCFVYEFNLPFVCESKVTTGGGIADPDEDGTVADNPPHGQNAPNSYYKRCHAGGDIPLLEAKWDEVITVYVENGPPSLD
jgi:hypothetical protein